MTCFAAVVTSVRALSEDQSAIRASFTTSPFMANFRVADDTARILPKHWQNQISSHCAVHRTVRCRYRCFRTSNFRTKSENWKVAGYPTPTFRNYGSAFPIKAPSFASGYSFTEP